MIARLWIRRLTAPVLCMALVGCRGADNISPAEKPASASPHSGPVPLFAGTASCSGRSCHGGLEPRPGHALGQDEYTAWLIHDKHAEAFHALFNERSQRIAKNLGIQHAHEEIRCLSCHVTPSLAAEFARAPDSAMVQDERHFGVGCESCHGSAGAWLGPHTGSAWKGRTAAEKSERGMVQVNNPAELARACAGCHVGAAAHGAVPTRDVNHDLIAAGHPRLHFEMDVYLDNLPPHWNKAGKLKRDGQDFHARIWAQGQLAAAQAALELLIDRAQDKSRPWPEFAEYDCFACHHDLQGKSWRQQRQAHPGRRLGALPWGAWYFTMSRLLGDGLKNPDKSFRQPCDDLEQHMGRPVPNRADVVKQAQVAAAELKKLGTALTSDDPQNSRRWLRAFGQDKRLTSDASWDAAMQLYLAMHALDPLQRAAIKKFEQPLAFPKDFDSPPQFDRRQFEELLDHLPR